MEIGPYLKFFPPGIAAAPWLDCCTFFKMSLNGVPSFSYASRSVGDIAPYPTAFQRNIHLMYIYRKSIVNSLN
jgi:hypothetical protein